MGILEINKQLGLATVLNTYAESKSELEKKGFREITLPEDAKSRIQEGKYSYLSKNGHRVKEDIIYIPKKGAFLTKNPPISESAKEATDAHSNKREFYPTRKQVEKALEDSVQIPYDLKLIPTNRFNENKITVYGFEKYAQDYGGFLIEALIKEMPIKLLDENYVNKQKRPFARKLWFAGLSDKSMVVGYSKFLDFISKWTIGIR